MPEEQYPPFVTIVGCTKVIYLPAGIKVVYGFSIDEFTNPKVGGYYAVSTTGNSSGEILNLYIFNGNEFFDVGNIYMFFEEFTINGKIRRDKIESLALLDVVVTTDDSLDEFLDHYEDYTFQTNDLIAIRVPGGGYQMFLYTGGPEWDESSYLSMGISTITISQVIGLADELDELRRKNVEQDDRLDGLDSSVFDINSAIHLIQLKDLEQDGRLDNLELSVSTINGAIGSINNLLQTHTNQIGAVTSGLADEVQARILGDTTLQNQINTLVLNKANTDASNISHANAELWREKLNIQQIQDSVISTGEVTADSFNVYLGLPLTGKNSVLINGQIYERTDAQTFPFTPVTTGEKILIIHALPDVQVFHLVQGAEGTEAVEPSYSGLFVARILVNSTGQVVEEEENDYKVYADDAWRHFSINQDSVYTINMANSLASSFSINVAAGVSMPTIGLIKQKGGKSFRNGAEFWIHNVSNKDIILYPSDFTDFDVWKHITFTETTIVKAESWAKLKIKYGELVVIEMGGSASFPEGAAPGDVLIEGTEGPEWSNRLTNAENEIDTEIVNRALADGALQTQITTEKNRNDTQDGQIADLYIGQAKFTVTSSITNETLSTDGGLKQNNRNNLIANGVNAINITLTATAEAKFQAIYHKLGSGTITFVAGSGVSLVLIDGTAKMEGTAELQTAAVHRDGNKYYVQISNR